MIKIGYTKDSKNYLFSFFPVVFFNVIITKISFIGGVIFITNIVLAIINSIR